MFCPNQPRQSLKVKRVVSGFCFSPLSSDGMSSLTYRLSDFRLCLQPLKKSVSPFAGKLAALLSRVCRLLTFPPSERGRCRIIPLGVKTFPLKNPLRNVPLPLLTGGRSLSYPPGRGQTQKNKPNRRPPHSIAVRYHSPFRRYRKPLSGGGGLTIIVVDTVLLDVESPGRTAK